MNNEEMHERICGQLKAVDLITLRMILAMLNEYEDKGLSNLERKLKANMEGQTSSFAAEKSFEYYPSPSRKKNEDARKAICNHLKIMDVTALRMVDAMLQAYNAPESEEDELLHELQRISKAHKSGQSPGFEAKEAIAYVRQNRKKPLE